MFKNGKKFFHVFTAGQYAQAIITAEDVRQIAEMYDVRFREAPLWMGHPDDDPQQVGSHEPRALAWIDSVIADGDKLYVSFSFISDELKQLIQSKQFKYVSVEIRRYKATDGKEFKYLFALGLTNRPAVKGLEPLQFRNQELTAFAGERFLFTEANHFSNQNHNSMNKLLIKLAGKFGIDVSKFTDDDKLSEAIEQKTDELTSKFTALETKVDGLEKKINPPADNKNSDPQFKELNDKIALMEEKAAIQLVDSAIAQGKIIPADRQKYIDAAKKDYALTESVFAGIKAANLTEKQINGGSKVIDLTDPKFKAADGKAITYQDYLKDSSLWNKYTDEEVAKLREADPNLK